MQNVHKSTEDMWWIIDWKLFYDYLIKKFDANKIIMFIWYLARYQKLYNKLTDIWYSINFKEVLIRKDGSIKWDVDIDIAIQAMKDIHNNSITKAYLVTWDADYNTLIDEWVKEWIWWRLLVPNLGKTMYILRKAAQSKIQALTDIKHLYQNVN